MVHPCHCEACPERKQGNWTKQSQCFIKQTMGLLPLRPSGLRVAMTEKHTIVLLGKLFFQIKNPDRNQDL
ncbi:MAG TPA: hypothetical protein DCY48_01305 [Candidatus Magasanikbacteria bacterium]|nr:MAG: hypothetical protein A3I74_03770 [Candidatus Magasanikbacteria bacterium RIFCSPLOWO2_02_FULL_47_16]OGH79286.1 MAG: hypothetical protein A3C10_04315 [Candidatus Magasanikbacteria bacterium RIFCSPHIGHO2_02_FULL_48_18]HAZ28395.1 hypothetical protein [Candidatus Magasanikbacteria bacterium]